ncbi:MAG: cyclic pyranopterin monophosphate synthase MoaC [Candidatus Aminicenantes bacterium]|nr:cyclic pyranopterin monophosphate synthase MoaC [Candidatus Aminicenantes bacterium]
MKLTHVNEAGEARMVDVSAKPFSRRKARASGTIRLRPETLELIKSHQVQKGDVLATARTAAIAGAKRTSELVPLCHNIPIDAIDVRFDLRTDGIDITAEARCEAKTGIEMEALTAVAVAALTIYDMCKAVDKTMVIGDIRLLEKTKDAIHD